MINEYKGITREFNPSWDGWNYIDTYFINDEELHCLDSNMPLQKLVDMFYLKDTLMKIVLNVAIWLVLAGIALLVTKEKVYG